MIFINEIFNKNKSKKNLVENSRIGFKILDSEINFRIILEQAIILLWASLVVRQANFIKIKCAFYGVSYKEQFIVHIG